MNSKIAQLEEELYKLRSEQAEEDEASLERYLNSLSDRQKAIATLLNTHLDVENVPQMRNILRSDGVYRSRGQYIVMSQYSGSVTVFTSKQMLAYVKDFLRGYLRDLDDFMDAAIICDLNKNGREISMLDIVSVSVAE